MLRTIVDKAFVDTAHVVVAGTGVDAPGASPRMCDLEGDRYATESDRTPYAFGQKFGWPDGDVWVIDLSSGRRTRALEKVRHYFGADRGRRRPAWFDG